MPQIAYDSRQQLSQVQNGILPPSELYLSLEELGRQLDIMEQLVHRESAAQRSMWNRKILELRQDSTTLRRQGEQFDRMVHTNVRQQREREELLRRRRRPTQNGKADERDMGNLAEEAQSLQHSTQKVEEILVSGQASYENLVDQRGRMRNVRRAVMNIGNRLGLTNATMRIIERRDITDAYLVLAGMIITCIVIYFCWFHFD
eukprot:CAMPEP_0194041226 /NCGR_PEP_ID=MMETSP0009_2-20130614/13125_1 /TAXON_ID=210454 /ORGANISM="Grammatophora oceanica, Strain CCMP 410" /LENGTH=202 /DNA_ID=CAMNT_0038684631 /DNA_START=62 /DNA_END=671 /DNA_ORIENTATION=+